PMVGGHVDLQGACQCAAIVTLAVGIAKGNVMIPTGMMGVELHRTLKYAKAFFPLADISDHVPEYCRSGGIHAIQGKSAIRGGAESREVFLEEQRRCQRA